MRYFNGARLAAAALLIGASMSAALAQTQQSLAVKDANGTGVNLCNVTSATGSVQVQCANLYVQGAQVGAGNPVPITAALLPLPTGAATATGVAQVNTTLGSPFQAGGSIGNTAFGISGTLPGFAATPTVNIGTSTLALEAGGNLAGLNAKVTTTANGIKVDGSAVTQPVAGTVTANLGTLNGAATAALQGTANTTLTAINSTLGSPLQAGGTVQIADKNGVGYDSTTPTPVIPDGVSDGNGGSAPTTPLTATGTLFTFTANQLKGFGSITITPISGGGVGNIFSLFSSNDNGTHTGPLQFFNTDSASPVGIVTRPVTIGESYCANIGQSWISGTISTYVSGSVQYAYTLKRNSCFAPPSTTLSANPIVGQQALTATATALPSNVLLTGVLVKALPSNIGTVYVGTAGVTTSTGYPLAAGESISFSVANSSGIYVLDTNTTDKVAFVGN